MRRDMRTFPAIFKCARLKLQYRGTGEIKENNDCPSPNGSDSSRRGQAEFDLGRSYQNVNLMILL